MNDPIQKLVEIFSHFPGIGARQARRFAYYVLTRDSVQIKNLIDSIQEGKKTVIACSECGRLFSRKDAKLKLCDICADSKRETSLLMVVARDVDVESIEKSYIYHGYYFVLGGTVPILDEKPETRVRISPLQKKIEEKIKTGLKEIVLAFDLNPEGEHTVQYVSKTIAPLVEKNSLTLTLLGRGLSTGTELQYSDSDTIKNALQNRASVK